MLQFLCGFSLGVYVATEYDLSKYVDASKNFIKNLEKEHYKGEKK
jgi:hypothetical protein